MKTRSILFYSLLCALSILSGYAEANGYLALDNGYRWDSITQRVTLGGPDITVKGSTLTLKQINSYQLGARGQWTFCECAFIKAKGHYGWIFDSGKYREGGFTGHVDGHTWDAYGALGYYFCLNDGIWIAPIAGWSYDALNLNVSNVQTTINCFTYKLHGIKANQRFNGPFVGFDLLYEINPCWDFTFGYEYHFSSYQGDRLIKGREYGNPSFGWTTGYSNKRHLDYLSGQVFTLDTSYETCNCYQLGLELKFQFYNGDHGHYRRTKVPLISNFTYANVDGLWWRSFALMTYIGKEF